MHILLLTEKGVDLDRYKAKLDEWGISYQEATAPAFKWKDGTADRVWLSQTAASLFDTYGSFVDVVQFFIRKPNWKARKTGSGKMVMGQHYAKTYSGYQFCTVKASPFLKQTGLHELMHTFDNVVRIYLGISLASIVGVTDWDEDVVHGRDRRFKESDYDTPYAMVRDHVRRATLTRKKQSLLERLQSLQRQLALKKKDEDLGAPLPQQLLDVAIRAIGTDASPSDLAPDELGCAETVSTLLSAVIPGFPIVTGTWSLLDVLKRNPQLREVRDEPQPGDIMLYVTGQGVGIFPGHVGIVGEDGKVMSNNSPTGTFEQNYTITSFRDRYVRWGGFPEHIFRFV